MSRPGPTRNALARMLGRFRFPRGNESACVLLAVTVIGLGGCAPKQFGSVHYAREIVLTSTSPADRDAGIQLLRVEPDGAAVITATRSGETLAAKPGQRFLGERGPGPYDVRVFGEEGLTLLRSDYATQQAAFLIRWAEPYD